MTKTSKWILVEDWLDLQVDDHVKAVKTGFYRPGLDVETSTTVRTTVVREGLLHVIPGVGYTSAASVYPDWTIYRKARKAAKTPPIPVEPVGEGYIYGFVRDENGYELPYWRNRDGQWMNHKHVYVSWEDYFSIRPGSTFHRLVIG